MQMRSNDVRMLWIGLKMDNFSHVGRETEWKEPLAITQVNRGKWHFKRCVGLQPTPLNVLA